MFKEQIRSFNDSIIALRDFVDLISSMLEEKITESNNNIMPILLLGLLEEGLKNKETSGDNKEVLESVKSNIQSKINDKYGEDVYFEFPDKEDGDLIPKKSFTVKFKSKKESEFLSEVEKVNKARGHNELVYRSSLISLISSVEWFFSQILHYYYSKHPEAANIQKKTITLSDLKGFSSISDAEDYLIDLKIEDILRSNFESWIFFLKSELSLGLGYINPLMDELTEIYQRRNILVHNGGIVNSIYISKVKEIFRKDIKIGDELKIDKAYLDNAIVKCQKAFILIACELWKNIDKSDKERGEILTEIIYENLLKGRWDICEGLTYFVLHDAQLDAEYKIVAQLNYWLVIKRKGQYESIKADIGKADFSDKKEIYGLALSALKDEKENFFKLLPHVLDSKQLSLQHLEEFPVFKEMRESQEYQDFKANSKYFITENEKSNEGDDSKLVV